MNDFASSVGVFLQTVRRLAKRTSPPTTGTVMSDAATLRSGRCAVLPITIRGRGSRSSGLTISVRRRDRHRNAGQFNNALLLLAVRLRQLVCHLPQTAITRTFGWINISTKAFSICRCGLAAAGFVDRSGGLYSYMSGIKIPPASSPERPD